MGETLSSELAARHSPIKRAGWLALLYAVIVIIFYRETVWSVVSIWQRSETYAHGYLIVPIILWLIWNKRDLLAKMEPAPAMSVLLLLVPGGAVWLLAYLVDVLVIQQLALVGILIVGIWAIVGHGIARLLAFPLGFLILAVPMGEDLVPPMMELTATSTVWLIKMTGIPVYREGLYFTLPSGKWSVVEACSGVRYLIASLTLGLLYAHLTYKTLGKQLLFVLASILVPIVANTLRAYIIVMLGHLSDMTIATGVDHLIYGWVFFGLVMFLLFWLGSLWRDDVYESPTGTDEGSAAIKRASHFGPVVVMITAVVAAGFWPVFSSALERPSAIYRDQGLIAPAAGTGWDLLEQAQWDWQPVNPGADGELVQFYSQGGQAVAVYLQQYLQQEQGVELVSGKSSQFIDEKESWRIAARRNVLVAMGNEGIGVHQVRLTNGAQDLLLWSWFRIGSHYTANPYIAKLHEAVEAISFGRQDSARIVLATRFVSEEHSKEVLEAFLIDNFSAIEASLDAVYGDHLND